MPGGAEVGTGLKSPIYSNPLLGVIGLESKADLYDFNGTIIDIVFSFDGFFQGIAQKGTESLHFGPLLDEENYIPLCVPKSKNNLSISLGYITYYLQRTSGKNFDVHSYYFNNDFFKVK